MGFREVSRGGGMTMKIDAFKVGRALGAYPHLFAEEAQKAFRDGGIHWEREMKQAFTGYTGNSGRNLQNRSGNLRRTIQYRVSGEKLRALALTLQVGDNRSPYAMTQERGAVITPKNGKYLTVPLSDAMTPSGVVRGDAIVRGSGNDYFTDRGPTSILPINGKLFVVDGAANGRTKDGRFAGKLRFLYILKESVTIPGPDSTGGRSRLGAERRARTMVSTKLGARLTAAADRAWNRGGGLAGF